MKFKKKMTIRLYTSIIFAVLGIVMIAIAFATRLESGAISSFGIGMTIYGLARIKQYFYITSNENRLKSQEILENDERNISIAYKARSITFTIFITLSYAAIVILSVLNMHYAAELISYLLLALVVIYLITYTVIRKIS